MTCSQCHTPITPTNPLVTRIDHDGRTLWKGCVYCDQPNRNIRRAVEGLAKLLQ